MATRADYKDYGRPRDVTRIKEDTEKRRAFGHQLRTKDHKD